MTQRNVRGAYMNFTHDRVQDWDWLAKWQPNVIRLMVHGSHSDPNSVSMPLIRRVHDTCPDATILLRCWDVDDRNFEAHAAMAKDAIAEANKQVEWWARVFDNANRAGVSRDRLMAGLNNETGPEKDGALYMYSHRALLYGTQLDVRLGVFVFSVGRPALPGDAEFTIDTFAQLDAAVLANRGAVILHEYMQPEGMYAVWTDDQSNERKDYTYLVGRNRRWNIKSPIIIAEWGIDGILYNRHPDPKFGNSGWRNFKDLWPPNRYADEYVECVRQASDNVIAICPFISDFADHKWQSFDLLDAYGEFLARKDLCVKASTAPPIDTHLPTIIAPGPTPAQPQEPSMPSDNWTRSRAFVARWEGEYQNVPNDRGNWTGGEVGVGENKGTKWGISAASYPHLDIKSLTKAQADAIYERDYWVPSGASALAWPACLLVFDTAVLHGVGTAQTWLVEVGPNPYMFAAKRLRVYTKMSNWDFWGKGWTNRVADLLEEMAT